MNDLKNQQKIGEANGMFDLPIVPTQVMKTGNVGSVHVFTFGPRGQCNALKWSLMVSKNHPKIGKFGFLDAASTSHLLTLDPIGQGNALRAS